MNWEIRKALKIENRLPELSAYLMENGRRKDTEELLEKMKKEERTFSSPSNMFK